MVHPLIYCQDLSVYALNELHRGFLSKQKNLSQMDWFKKNCTNVMIMTPKTPPDIKFKFNKKKFISVPS